MRKIITLLAVLFSLNAQAQTLHIDSAMNNKTYVNVSPYLWEALQPQVNRVYAWAISDDLQTSAIIHYELRAAVQIDANTVNTVLIKYWNVTLSGSAYTSFKNDVGYIFTNNPAKSVLTIID